MIGKTIKGFQQFILKGNVVDLSVGIIIGAAFTSVVQAFVRDLLTPLITAFGGQPTFADLSFTINNSIFRYGDFFNALISFLITSAVVYFFVVSPMNQLLEANEKKSTTLDPSTIKCPYCFSEIPSQSTRCKYCTSKLQGDEKDKEDDDKDGKKKS